jgi:hypothetical protein
MESGIKKAYLATIINHVFLPPKLPGGKDTIPIEEQLLEYVLFSLEEFKAVVDQIHHAAIHVVIDALDHLKTVTPSCEIISASGLRLLLSANSMSFNCTSLSISDTSEDQMPLYLCLLRHKTQLLSSALENQTSLSKRLS